MGDCVSIASDTHVDNPFMFMIIHVCEHFGGCKSINRIPLSQKGHANIDKQIMVTETSAFVCFCTFVLTINVEY